MASPTVKKTPKIGEGLAGPGRPKGMPNKATALLKDAILLAARRAGGDTDEGVAVYLERQAIDNPGPFMSLLGKVLPMQITGAEDGSPLSFTVIYEAKKGIDYTSADN